MREITLNRIPYRELDYDGDPKSPTSIKYFSFLDLFYGDKKAPINISINNSLNTERYSGDDSLTNRLTNYFNVEGRSAFSELWSIPNLPFLINLPTENHPEFQDKRDNIIETLPKQIDSSFNQKLNQTTKKKLLKNCPLHPVLKDHNNPSSKYASPEVIEINVNYPPFYNKYLDAKKKAGLQ